MRRVLAPALLALVPACNFPTEHEAFDVTDPITSVLVRSQTGDITVRGGATDVVHVDADLTWYRDKPKVTWEVQDDRLVVTAECDNPPWCTVDLVLEVPRDVALDVRLTTGDVAVQDLDGDVDLQFTTGNTDLGYLLGTVYVHTTTGRIVGRRLSGDTIDAVVSTGDIDLIHEGAFTRISALSRTGNIQIGVPAGTYDCVTENDVGDISVIGIDDDPDATSEITATTNTGNIEITGYTVAP